MKESDRNPTPEEEAFLDNYDHSNDCNVPVYDGDHIIYVTPPEYYRRWMGAKAIDIQEESDGK